MIGSIYDKTQFNETNIATVIVFLFKQRVSWKYLSWISLKEVHSFYEALMNRLFVMGDLRRIDIFGDVPNLDADVAALKELSLTSLKYFL